MSDPTEYVRQVLAAEINADPASREALEAKYGKVWDTKEMQVDYEPIGFAAPFIIVRRRVDGKQGALTFQHGPPRLYFDFTESSR